MMADHNNQIYTNTIQPIIMRNKNNNNENKKNGKTLHEKKREKNIYWEIIRLFALMIQLL